MFFLGERYEQILGFCGELCDLTKHIEPGLVVGTVKAKVGIKYNKYPSLSSIIPLKEKKQRKQGQSNTQNMLD